MRAIQGAVKAKMDYVQNFEHNDGLSDVQERLGKRIRFIRRANNMSQKELARASQQQRPYIGELERGKYSARIDTLHLIAQGLKVSLSVLFEGVG